MFSHADVWRGIDRLAVTFGYSPSGLAKKAGLDPTTFNKSKRVSNDGKPRWPSTESIAKILDVTGVTMGEFFALTDSGKKKGGSSGGGRVIPLLGFAQAGREGYFDEDGAPSGRGWDQVEFPGMHKTGDSAAYALEVNGDSMLPLYRDGDIIVVSPHATPRRGDRVVVRTKNGEVMVKELARKAQGKIELRSLNEDHDTITLGPRSVTWMARIIWVSQ